MARHGHSEYYQRLISDKLSSQPQEWLLEVVIGFRGNVVVLKILLAMEGDSLGFDFAFFHVDLVAAKDNGNIFADSDQIT